LKALLWKFDSGFLSFIEVHLLLWVLEVLKLFPWKLNSSFYLVMLQSHEIYHNAVNNINLLTFSCKMADIFVWFESNLYFHDRFIKSPVSSLLESISVESELMLADRQMDRQTWQS